MLRRGQFYSEWLRRPFRGRILYAEGLSGLGALVCYVLPFIWPSLEGKLNVFPLLIFGAFFLGTIAVGMLRAPFGLYTELASEIDEKQDLADVETETLKKKFNEVTRKLDRGSDFIECARKLAALITEGNEMRRITREDITEMRADWHERVMAVFEEYYPEAGADFSTIQSRRNPIAQQDILAEELGKLGGIMIRLSDK